MPSNIPGYVTILGMKQLHTLPFAFSHPLDSHPSFLCELNQHFKLLQFHEPLHFVSLTTHPLRPLELHNIHFPDPSNSISHTSIWLTECKNVLPQTSWAPLLSHPKDREGRVSEKTVLARSHSSTPCSMWATLLTFLVVSLITTLLFFSHYACLVLLYLHSPF